MSIGLSLLLAVVFLGVLGVFLYNAVIKLKNKCNEAWADIDTQLKRRYDLIPNLVETVKGYASHESQTLEKVVQARTAAMNAQSIKEKEQAENMLSDTLKSIFALSEQYPELKANQNFLDLQKTLKEIEEHIQMSRRYYNATVRDFNTKIQTFPNNIFAKMFSFKDREFFQATDEEKQNTKVSFSASETSTSEANEESEANKPEPAEAPAEEEKPKEEPPASATEGSTNEANKESGAPSQPPTPPQPPQA